jgi:hypothetical protein
MFLELKTLFGLPAHPFLIHAPLVLIPLTGLVVIAAMLWKPSVRQRWTLPLAGVCLVLLVLVQLAIGSGEALKGMGDEANNPTVLQHQADADALRLILLGQTAVLLVLGLLTRQAPTAAAAIAADPADDPGAGSAADPPARSLDRRRVVQGGLRVLAGGAAAATIGYTFVTGHTGATAVWQHRGEGRRPGAEGERGGSTSGFSGSNDGAPSSFRGDAPPATPASRPLTGDADGGAEPGSGGEPGG